MDRLRSIQVAIQVAEHSGFAAAARRLNMSPPAVTRAVSLLENHLETRLFVRSTRTVRLTDAGRRFLDAAKQVLADLDEAEKAAMGSHAEPSGELFITAPVLFGRMFVTPVLNDFLARHPQMTARTLFVDRNVNLMEEGIDLAVRIGDLPDSSLTAIRCGSVRQVVVASPDYLLKQGTPDRPDQLDHHATIHSVAVSASPQWQFQNNGKTIRQTIRPKVQMNTNDAVIEMALCGAGLARVLSYQAAPHIAAGRLRPVLDRFRLDPAPIHLIHQEGRRVSAKTRRFADLAVERFRANPHIH